MHRDITRIYSHRYEEEHIPPQTVSYGSMHCISNVKVVKDTYSHHMKINRRPVLTQVTNTPRPTSWLNAARQ